MAKKLTLQAYLKENPNALEKLSLENMQRIDKEVKKDSIYGYESKIIKNFIKDNPKNTVETIIAIKIMMIDYTNSTNLSMQKNEGIIQAITKEILEHKDFDKMLENGDTEAVNIISKQKAISTDKKIKIFSFATKYCTYHSANLYEDSYSIYDSIVSILLPHYAKKVDLKITTYDLQKYREACDYAAFNEVIKQVLRKNNIMDKKIRIQFDHFLWWQGKKCQDAIKNSQTMQISKPDTLQNLTDKPKDKAISAIFKGCKLYATHPHTFKGNQAMHQKAEIRRIYI